MRAPDDPVNPDFPQDLQRFADAPRPMIKSVLTEPYPAVVACTELPLRTGAIALSVWAVCDSARCRRENRS